MNWLTPYSPEKMYALQEMLPMVMLGRNNFAESRKVMSK